MLFIQNKYTKWYYQIIESAKQIPYSGYTEKHHIIPKSLGGSNDPTNIVPLSARQHFICHMLLTKMVRTKGEKHKMIRAIWAMSTLEYNTRQSRYVVTSKLYAQLRKLYSIEISKCNPMHDPVIQSKRLQTWKKNRANREYIPPRILKDKFITPLGIFKTKKAIRDILQIPEHTLNTIYDNLDSQPNSNGRRSKKIEHLNIDYNKTWRENGFGYI